MNALARSLDFVLHGQSLGTNRTIHVLDYCGKAVFSDLWLNGLESETPTIDETTFNWRDSGEVILIIGIEPPEGPFERAPASLQGINFRGHLTATSWLAAWKMKFPGANANIAIIDIHEPSLASGASRALQTIFGARNALGQTLVPRASVFHIPSLNSICQWIRDSKSDTRPLPTHIPHLLRSSIWNELVSTREQHHALSNVLGALLLSSQVGKGVPHPGDPWAQDFLLALVRACGIEADLNQVKVMEHIGFQKWITLEQQSGIGAAVFIDDMGELWEHFLRGALGFAGETAFGTTGRSFRESLEVFDNEDFGRAITELPGRLLKFFQSRRPVLTAADLLGRESKVVDEFVLFLDLRLFSGRERGGSDEAGEMEFLRGLAEFGITLLDSKRNLPWAHGESRESLRKELERFTEPKPFTAGADEFGQSPRETILPRLVSLLDPTLPIIVFSSTRRTELIEPFRNYGNIITTFHKPVLTGLAGDWAGMVREMHAGFASAVDQAARILRVREIVRPFYKPLQAN